MSKKINDWFVRIKILTFIVLLAYSFWTLLGYNYFSKKSFNIVYVLVDVSLMVIAIILYRIRHWLFLKVKRPLVAYSPSDKETKYTEDLYNYIRPANTSLNVELFTIITMMLIFGALALNFKATYDTISKMTSGLLPLYSAGIVYVFGVENKIDYLYLTYFRDEYFREYNK
ncbi:hypothetical protein [Weissella confusa]